MNLLNRVCHNLCRADVDLELHMMWQPGWYDVYTTKRLTHQTDCATYCTNLYHYLELLREVAQLDSRYSE